MSGQGARSQRKKIVLGAAVLATLLFGIVLLFLLRSGAERPKRPLPLERGAFSVVVPGLAKAPPEPEKPEPKSAPTGPEPEPAPKSKTGSGGAGKPSKGGSGKQKKKTGPGGIYIPPPSEWF
jgi:hypothetical protein